MPETKYIGSDGLTYLFSEDMKTVEISGTGTMTATTTYIYGQVDNNVGAKVNLCENVIINEGVTGLGNYAFYTCTRLKGIVTIPSSIQSIGNSAFVADNQITGFNFLGTQPTLNPNSLKTENSVMTIYTKGWGSSSVFNSNVIGYPSLTLVNGISAKMMRDNNNPLIVDFAERDSSGKVIKDAYQEKVTITDNTSYYTLGF